MTSGFGRGDALWRRGFYLVLNAIGIGVYLHLALPIWALRETEGRDYYDAVDCVTHFLWAVPVLAVFTVINLIYFGIAIVVFVKRRVRAPLVVCGVACAMWLGGCEFESYKSWMPEGTWHWYSPLRIRLECFFHD